MDSDDNDLVIHSSRTKQLGGLWYLASSFACFALWFNGEKSSGAYLLFGLSLVIFLMGIYRVLTKSVTVIRAGEIPRADKQTLHFGFYKVNQSADFDKITVLRRENLLPYCQLFAYSSLEYLKTRLSPDELRLYEAEQKHLPGLIIADHITKKECDSLNEKVWRLYGMWDDQES
jgi:hypothetical protein